MAEKMSKMYFTGSGKKFPGGFEVLGTSYEKIEDLRYGTNPNQGAAFYRPKSDKLGGVIGAMEMLKSGKGGLSQTNLEDIHHALGIVKYFERPACAVMKHLNPSGAAAQHENEDQLEVYKKARDCDSRAAFGSVVAFNTPLGVATAEEIMATIVEGVVAPAYEEGAAAVFEDFGRFRRNRHIRVLQCGPLDRLPRFEGDDTGGVLEIKVLGDGALVAAEPFLSSIRGESDLLPARATNKEEQEIICRHELSASQALDVLFAWYVNFNVRSNGVVIAHEGRTIAVGTGQQDRVGAVEQAVAKAESYHGADSLNGTVLASDGFFPFRDSIDSCAKAGIAAIIQPGGSLRDFEVVEACNEHGIAMVFTGERCFSHH
ncbi:MAG: IMP cyclohydrolase [Candidatus Glassbacteria bacterium]|nr:IMP cyclohydrolase [Candidatus Glassbacteria bacterium]